MVLQWYWRCIRPRSFRSTLRSFHYMISLVVLYMASWRSNSSELRLASNRCFSAKANLLYRVFRSVSVSKSWARLYDRSVFNWFSVMLASDSSELWDSKCLVLLMTSQLSRRPAFPFDTRTLEEWSTVSDVRKMLEVFSKENYKHTVFGSFFQRCYIF